MSWIVLGGALWSVMGADPAGAGAIVAPRAPVGALDSTLLDTLVPDNLPNADYGFSVAVDQDTLVVGARFDGAIFGVTSGVAYVYVRNGNQWDLQQELIGDDAADGDQFGASVGISGDTIVVGAETDNSGGFLDTGAAYVFTRAGGVWTQQDKLTSQLADNARMGAAVAIEQDTIVSGAWGASAGHVYVFTRSGGVWTEQAELSSIGGEIQGFGRMLALDGDTLAVGVCASPSSIDIFTRTGDMWSPQVELIDPAMNPGFGCLGLGLWGDTLVVGLPYASPIDLESGAARVYERMGDMWNLDVELAPAMSQSYEHVGWGAAIEGDTIILGAAREFGKDPSYAYTYSRSGGEWYEQGRLEADDGVAGNQFGRAVAIDGRITVVGAQDAPPSGSAYVFEHTFFGQPCEECTTGFCVDGVCCDSECGGDDPDDCLACIGALTGGQDGLCAPVSADTTCRPASSECDLPEVCDGVAMTCPPDELSPEGTPCEGGGVCMGGVCEPGVVDETGTEGGEGPGTTTSLDDTDGGGTIADAGGTSDPSTGSDATGDPGASDGGDGGCSCRADEVQQDPRVLLGLLLLLFGRRRRARA